MFKIISFTAMLWLFFKGSNETRLVDNRQFTNKLYHLIQQQKNTNMMTCDTRHRTYDMWHGTCETWNVTHEMWQVGEGEPFTKDYSHNYYVCYIRFNYNKLLSDSSQQQETETTCV